MPIRGPIVQRSASVRWFGSAEPSTALVKPAQTG